ncbi:MAG: CidA/LrgA family protein [Tepidiphilus sp.]|jgi:putative effector of murein hydrolase LrgA (UPF0299 family)|nr:CidA/LrgA family protein [Tepidiphilus sp.]
MESIMLWGLTALLALQLAGEVVVRFFHWPVPGPVMGLVFALALFLPLGRVPKPVEEAGGTLLRHLSLLFVPAGVGVVAHWERLQQSWLVLGVVLLVSTLLGLAVSAWVFERLAGGEDAL